MHATRCDSSVRVGDHKRLGVLKIDVETRRNDNHTFRLVRSIRNWLSGCACFGTERERIISTSLSDFGV